MTPLKVYGWSKFQKLASSKRGMFTFPYKGWEGLLPLFLKISLWFLACRPEFWSVFFNQKPKWGKNNFSLNFSRIFQTFFQKLCVRSKVINIGSGNSNIYNPFPPLLIPFPALSRIFPFCFYNFISLWFFACRPELWSSFESNTKM